jgi:hypothetical protein
VETEELPVEIHHLFVVPVAGLDLPAMHALAYAASLQQPVLALHVSPTQGEAERFRDNWRIWGDHLPLEVIVSPYRAIVAPLVNYIDSLHDQRRDLTLTITLPEIVVRRWWQRILHNQTRAAAQASPQAAAEGGRDEHPVPCAGLGTPPQAGSAEGCAMALNQVNGRRAAARVARA